MHHTSINNDAPSLFLSFSLSHVQHRPAYPFMCKPGLTPQPLPFLDSGQISHSHGLLTLGQRLRRPEHVQTRNAKSQGCMFIVYQKISNTNLYKFIFIFIYLPVYLSIYCRYMYVYRICVCVLYQNFCKLQPHTQAESRKVLAFHLCPCSERVISGKDAQSRKQRKIAI